MKSEVPKNPVEPSANHRQTPKIFLIRFSSKLNWDDSVPFDELQELRNALSRHASLVLLRLFLDSRERIKMRCHCEVQIAILVDKTLGRLVNPKGIDYQTPQTSTLVLAGGLMKNERYRDALEKQIDHLRLYFRRTVVVEDAALAGA
jgi:hypothetical protein